MRRIAVAMCVLATRLSAQATTADVHIFVALSDSSTRFYPVPAHRMFIYRSPRDSVLAITDSSGSTTVYLAPGKYRLVSASPVGWHGYDYSWNVPILVGERGAMIDLRAPDATITGRATGTSQRPSVVSPVPLAASPTPDSASPPTSTGHAKSSDIAGTLGLIPGLGHMYAGDFVNGVAIAGVFGGATALAFHQAQRQVEACLYTDPNCAQGDGAKLYATLAVAAALYTWYFSISDASKAADRYNKAHGFTPTVSSGAKGTTRLGLAVSF